MLVVPTKTGSWVNLDLLRWFHWGVKFFKPTAPLTLDLRVGMAKIMKNEQRYLDQKSISDGRQSGCAMCYPEGMISHVSPKIKWVFIGF